jgi:carboxylesterase type B
VDGDFITRWSSIQLAEGDFVRVPIIDGANSDEGESFGPANITSDALFLYEATNASAGHSTVPPQFSSELLAAYPVEPAYFIPTVERAGPANNTAQAQQRRSNAYFGDVVMIANRRGAMEAWTKYGVPAYSYRFDTAPNPIPLNYGVPHFQEVAFVFDNTQGLGYDALHGTVNPYGNKSESYYDLGFLMSSSWASFIHDLNPNFSKHRLAAAPQWPVYDNAKPENIVWNAEVKGVATIEPDTFRKEGIAWILEHALLYHR